LFALTEIKAMTMTVTLELPEPLAYSASQIARRTQRRLEDVLVEWIDQAAADIPVELLSDAQVLALSEEQLASDLQAELSELLALNREGELTTSQRSRFDSLMQLYRQQLVRKAQAVKEAVNRRLRPSLSEA